MRTEPTWKPLMRVMIWLIAGSSSLVLGLLTGIEQIGSAGWPVLTLFLVSACCQITQPRLAMLLFGIAGVVSIGAIARDDLVVGIVISLAALLLVALTALAWRRDWRQMRRQIVYQAIDQKLVPGDSPQACELTCRPERVRRVVLPALGSRTSTVLDPAETHQLLDMRLDR